MYNMYVCKFEEKKQIVFICRNTILKTVQVHAFAFQIDNVLLN